MTADCPTCHAPVEFRFDDSFVRVCEHCNSAVVRTDRGVETLGKFADLAPIESPLSLFAEGHDRGSSFLLVGMAQLRHAAGGLWQEWYAKLDGGQWGWLSEAQGRYYMTHEVTGVAAPPFASLAPGAPIAIMIGNASREFTVGELGSASYASARGEIPYRLVPGAAFRFADLAAADGSFLTIDYGDPADAEAMPTVYVGRQITLAELQLSGGEPSAPAAAADKITSAKIACPNCNGSLDIRAPGQSLRVACPYCGTLVSLESGAPSILARAAQVAKPDLKLGAKGTFAEGEMQIIGYLQRSAGMDGEWFAFDEYLLFAPAIGFRWLVNSDGHWSYVQPIAPGAVEPGKPGQTCKYDGVTFRMFQSSDLRVDQVLGEMYWRVAVGDVVRGEDFIAPPAMLSLEATGSEESWSLSSYLTPAELHAALHDDALVLPTPIGVAPNEPARAQTATHVMSFGVMTMLGLGLVFALTSSDVRRFSDVVAVPSAGSAAVVAAGSGSDVVAAAYFSPPFHLAGGQNIAISFEATVDNDWVYAAADLVDDKTGGVTSVEAELEHYSGVEDGESWSEGDATHSEILGPVPAGQYLLRVESQHGGSGAASIRVDIHQDVYRGLYLLFALLALMIPYSIVGLVSGSHEKRRWDNSTVDDKDKPSTGVGIAFIGFRLLFLGLWALIQIVAAVASDD